MCEVDIHSVSQAIWNVKLYINETCNVRLITIYTVNAAQDSTTKLLSNMKTCKVYYRIRSSKFAFDFELK